MRLTRTTWMWAALAVAGLIVAAGVSYAASQLTKPSVGLTNEPLSAGARLSPTTTPAARAKPKHAHHRARQHAATPAPTPGAPTAAAPSAPSGSPAPAVSAPSSAAPSAPTP